MKAMIFAAGLGTRLKPLTDTIPKALVPIHGKPLLEHIILKLKTAGIEEIIVNVHHHPDMIIDFLNEKNNFNIRIEISDEREKLLDTGGGIKKASWFFDDGEPFLIHNVDILSNVDVEALLKSHQQADNQLVTLVVSWRETNRYLLFDKENKLHGWVNVKTGETKPTSNIAVDEFEKFAFSGIQIVSPKIFELMESEGDKFPIIDFYLKTCKKHKITGYVPEFFHMIDVGKIDSLEKAEELVMSMEF